LKKVKRLKAHNRDHLSERWNHFSWFGTQRVVGQPAKLSVDTATIHEGVSEMLNIMAVEMNSRISLKFFLGLAVLSCSLPGIARAQYLPLSTENKSKICDAISTKFTEYDVHSSPLDWPKHIKLSGLSWPAWTPIDAGKNIDLIKNISHWQYERGNNEEVPLSQYIQAFGTDADREREWIKYGKAIILRDINSGLITMEQAKISVSENIAEPTQLQSAVIVRYRFKPDQRKIKDVVDGRLTFLPEQYNWRYALVSYSIDPSLKDIPIGRGVLAEGEVATFGTALLLFDTNFYPNYEVDTILLNPEDSSSDYFTSFSIIPICSR